jgi:hypothetical protein
MYICKYADLTKICEEIKSVFKDIDFYNYLICTAYAI